MPAAPVRAGPAARSATAAAAADARTAPPCPDPAGTAPPRTATRTPRTPAHIDPPAHRPALDLLRRHVIRGPQVLPGPGQRRRRQRPLGQPEIRQAHMIRPALPRIHQNVRRLDIPVHQARRMRRIQRGGHRGDDRRRPLRRQRGRAGAAACARPRRGTNRITMNSTPSASPASCTGMICGSSTAAAARDSRKNRCRNPAYAARAGARTFSATRRPSRSSRARNTTAIPPAPTCSSSRYPRPASPAPGRPATRRHPPRHPRSPRLHRSPAARCPSAPPGTAGAHTGPGATRTNARGQGPLPVSGPACHDTAGRPATGDTRRTGLDPVAAALCERSAPGPNVAHQALTAEKPG